MSDPGDKINVLHLIGSTGLYGAERWILALMRAMDTDLVHSTLINLVDETGEASQVVLAAQERGLNALDFHTGGNLNPFSAIRLARWVREQHVQIIHGHGFKSDAVGLLAAKLAGCKALTTPHGWSLEPDRKLQFYEKLDRFLFRFMDMVCPLSLDLEAGIKECVNPHKLRLVYNGVDIDEVRETISAARNKSSAFVIGYIGQLIARKDLYTLLGAKKYLSTENIAIKVIMVGSGSEMTPLEEEAGRLGISTNVEFLGFRPDATSILKTFDLFILPSLMEGIPRCIMEAMAAGIPVVASDIPGNRALVTPGETGLLFKPGDSVELAAKIMEMISSPDKARAMAAAASEKIEAQYSNRRMAREYTALYQQLIGS